MLFDELPLGFPFYDKLEKQNRFKENTQRECIFKLICTNDRLLPFQFRKPTEPDYLTGWKLMYLSGDIAIDLAVNLPLIETEIIDDYDYFIYKGEQLEILASETLDIPEGYYYTQIETVAGTFYSEVFYVPRERYDENNPDLFPYLMLEWNDAYDFDKIYYTTGFVNRLYFDTFITNSEPEIIEDGVKDGEENFNPIFQKLQIKWNFVLAPCPDFLKIALNAMAIHGEVLIYTKNFERIGEVKEIKVNSEINEGGGSNIIKVDFVQPLYYKRTTCANTFDEYTCTDTGTEISNVSTVPGGLSVMGVAPINTIIVFYEEGTDRLITTVTREQLLEGAFISSEDIGGAVSIYFLAKNVKCTFNSGPYEL